VAKLRCKSGDGPDCLTDSEIHTIKAIVRGPHGPKGELLSEGMPITNMSMWQFNGAAPPPWNPEASVENLKTASSAYVIPMTTAHGLIRPEYDVLKDMDFSERAIREWDRAFTAGDFNVPSVPQDLVGFQKAGGKFIMWSGSSDPCCSYIEQENTYDNAAKFFGKDQVAKFFALYSIPGMGHCRGGSGPEDSTDMLLMSLIDWVEKGKDPQGVVAHRGPDRVQTPFHILATTAEADVPAARSSGGRSRDFLLCHYSAVSVFDKTKANTPRAVLEAANWSCRSKRGS
jgi:feruloyl esterase